MLFGIILIIIGLYVLLKFIFPGFAIDLNWSLIWPIILIVIGINSSIKFKKIDVFNIVIVIIGTICLLCNLNVIPKVNFKISLSIILFGLGISNITSSLKMKSNNVKLKNNTDLINFKGIFGGAEEKINDDKFKGANCYAIFGGVELDLRNSNIKQDIQINSYSIFGGIDLFVPENVNVISKSCSMFGGVDNKSKNKNNPNNKTIYINSTNMFGGVDIK